MSNETENKYPEHEKLTKVKDQSQTIGGFLESMGEQGLVLAEYVAADEYSEARLVPVNKSINNILAQHFGIDLEKLEKEKLAMLDQIRESNKQ